MMTETKTSMPSSSQYAVCDIPAYEALHPGERGGDSIGIIGGEEQLPLYMEDGFSTKEAIEQVATTLKSKKEAPSLPIQEYPPYGPTNQDPNSTSGIEQIRDIVNPYFSTIENGNIALVSAFLASNLVSTETTNLIGSTPLIAAVRAGHVHMVRYLLDIGAEKNTFGITSTIYSTHRSIRSGCPKIYHTYRTPLQHAAEQGNLPMVKLLLERGADDSAVAPDGQLALRLAATNGHREIVEYLPSRRGGGYRRWKVKHSQALYRVKKAGYKIYQFIKFFVWDVPRFFVWSVPKHLLVLPLIEAGKWVGKNWKEVPRMLKERAKKMGKGLKKLGKGVVKAIKELPHVMWKGIKGVAELLKSIVLWVWRVVKAIPNALKIVFLWLWNAIKSAVSTLGHVAQRFASFIHTMLAAIFSFFKQVTFRDVMNGFLGCLRAIFIDGPKKLWQWICSFGKMLVKVMKTLFGSLGECIVWIFKGVIWLVTFIPRKIWKILKACGSSVRHGGREVMVWVNPKRM